MSSDTEEEALTCTGMNTPCHLNSMDPITLLLSGSPSEPSLFTPLVSGSVLASLMSSKKDSPLEVKECQDLTPTPVIFWVFAKTGMSPSVKQRNTCRCHTYWKWNIDYMKNNLNISQYHSPSWQYLYVGICKTNAWTRYVHLKKKKFLQFFIIIQCHQ